MVRITQDTYTLSVQALPPALRELVRVLGEQDAFRLVGQHSGARVTVPKHPGPDHPLRMALSPEGFDKLVEWAGGETLNLPKGDAYMRELRHHQVREARADGLTVDETAAMTGYSRRHVINITGGHGACVDTATMDLFADIDEPVTSQAGNANDPFGLGVRRS